MLGPKAARIAAELYTMRDTRGKAEQKHLKFQKIGTIFTVFAAQTKIVVKD